MKKYVIVKSDFFLVELSLRKIEGSCFPLCLELECNMYLKRKILSILGISWFMPTIFIVSHDGVVTW